MKTKKEILQRLSACKLELESCFKVKTLAVFGSYARGDQGPDSDVDILVDVGPEIGLDFVTLAERLEALLELPVELVSRRALKPRAWHSIERDLVYV